LESLRQQRQAALAASSPLTQQEERENTKIQVRLDSVYAHVGRRAQPPQAFEKPLQYRRRLIKEIARYHSDDKMKNFDYHVVPESILDKLEPLVVKDIISRNDAISIDIPEDELIARQRVDPLSGQIYIDYFGKNTFIKHMKPLPWIAKIRDPLERDKFYLTRRR
jgi:hypothetical protein